MDQLSVIQIRQINHNEREKKLAFSKKSLLELRIKQATRQKIKTHNIKQYKKQVARIITIDKEK